MLTSLKLKLASIFLLTGTATETTETAEKLKGWDKFVDWAGGNFYALFIIVAGILIFGILIFKLAKYLVKKFKKNYVSRDKVAWYKKKKNY